ncbi:MAG: TonB-dependent receptor plug domain-containing protein [Gammaproteobacteria bacterium]
MRFRIDALSLGLLIASTGALAQDQTDADDAAALAEIVVTGTRVQDRSRLDTLAPVDVLTSEALASQASTELAEALSTIAPSLNFPRPSITDGTDHIRPATLRGLAPDQALVLVNSKRRHQSALVNVNGSIGRGSAAVDLNAIPLAAIERVEVLRDGASAQYGSDAIAGVINIRLREARDGGGAAVTFGEYESDVDTARGSRSENDGSTLTASVWGGLALGEEGFLTLTGEYRDRDPTSRGDLDPRVASLVPPEAPRVTSRYGDAQVEDITFYANAGVPLNNDWEVYGWAGFQQRDGESAAFPRLRNNPNNVLTIYPNGFLPLITTDIQDVTAAWGLRGPIGTWDADVSLVYGLNDLEYGVENSINGTLGATSPTSFDAGGFDYDQLVFNFGLVRGFDWGGAAPANVAVGLEARQESYSITAGELASYVNGGMGAPGSAPGAQGFPGFQPSNEVDEDRTAVGLYADVETQVTERFLGSIAVRVEDYSDFGSNVTGKVSGRYDFTEGFALRSTVSTGFRAPGLQQAFFTSTATNFIGGVPFEVGTFPATSQIAGVLGASELDAEESINYSLGAVFRAGSFEATIDGYLIEIDDRIVLSENLGGRADINALLQPFNVGRARFFINGVDTETTGVDVVLRYAMVGETTGRWDFTASANLNETDVKKLPSTGVLSALNPPPALFDRINILTFEEGTPDMKVTLAADWNQPVAFGSFGVGAKATHYGDVVEPTVLGTDGVSRDVLMGAETLVDLELRARFGDNFGATLGIDNVFDEYPDAVPAPLNSTGAQGFSRYSAFGFNGRFWYGRLSYNW